MYLSMWLFSGQKKSKQKEKYREATQTESGFAFLHVDEKKNWFWISVRADQYINVVHIVNDRNTLFFSSF